jgi:hypothetical protein
MKYIGVGSNYNQKNLTTLGNLARLGSHSVDGETFTGSAPPFTGNFDIIVPSSKRDDEGKLVSLLQIATATDSD